MDATAIEKFITIKSKKSEAINIHFKDRATVTGIFINTVDYEELKAKNFWRVVSLKNVNLWEKTKDPALSRLFNGTVFTRLSKSQ